MKRLNLVCMILMITGISVNAQELIRLKEIKYYMLNDNTNEGYSHEKDGYVFKYTVSNNFGIQYGRTYFDCDGRTLTLKDDDDLFYKAGDEMISVYMVDHALAARVYSLTDNKLLETVKAKIKIKDLFKQAKIKLEYNYKYYVSSIVETNESQILLSINGSYFAGSTFYNVSFYMTWDWKNPDNQILILPNGFPELDSKNSYEASNSNPSDDSWESMGYYQGKLYYARVISHKVKEGIDSSATIIAVYNMDGTLNQSFVLNNKVPDANTFIPIVGSVNYDKSVAYTRYFDKSEGTFYTLSFTQPKKENKTPALEISKYDINGNLIWNHTHQTMEKNVGTYIYKNFYLTSPDKNVYLVVKNALKSVYYIINPENGEVTNTNVDPELNSAIDKDVLKAAKDELKNDKDLDLLEKNITKVNDHNYFIAYHGKGRRYWIYQYKK